MAIPQIPQFEKLLSSISVHTEAQRDDRPSFDVVRGGFDYDGVNYFPVHPVTASYDAGELTLDAAIERIAKELKNSRHWSDCNADHLRHLVRLLLGIAAISRPANRPAAQQVNEILSATCEANHSAFLISQFPVRRPGRTRIGNFYVGEVDIAKLKYRCEKVGCDFFRRYPNLYRGAYGVGNCSTHPEHRLP
jgi:hypothetical protein